MLRASQAIRMGLRAASRNPELSFAKALLDLMGTVMSLLPTLFAGFVLWRAIAGLPILTALLRAVQGIERMVWPIAGALFTAAMISWLIGVGFWAGALPIVAVDVEMNERPANGLFLRLASNGFARVAGASAIANLLSLLVGVTLLAAVLIGLPVFILHPSPLAAAGLAAIFTCAFASGFFIDLLGSLALIRAAVLGDGPATAFVRGASLFGERVGSTLGVAVAFFLLELTAATGLGALMGPVFLDEPGVNAQLFALGPRMALTIASTTVFAWIALSRQAALAALAADSEGLINLPPEPPPPVRRVQRTQQRGRVLASDLRPPRIAVQPRTPEAPREQPVQEPIIEALPVPEQAVIEALPVPDPTGAPDPDAKA